MSEPELDRKNLAFAWGLVVLFLLLFGGTVAVAFIYLAAD
jgi:cbb3-type cytochrome oxidase subunit 3